VDERINELTERWLARDHARALVPEDHAAIDKTHAPRALVLTRLLEGGHADLFHACLMLGRLLAEHGGTPTLAAATMDGAFEETGSTGEWLVSARAALAEGYAAARIDRARADAMRAWDYPRCAVKLDATTTGFVACPPEDDDDALADWAAKVTVKAVRAKVRRARVDGSEKAKRLLEEALELAGVDVLRDPVASKKPLLERLPWLRRENK
jgi:hypothetical protein